MVLSKYELERERNIAKNKAILEALDLKATAVAAVPPKPATKAKPVKSSRPKKRSIEEASDAPRRQSSRLRKETIDPNESPGKRRKREQEVETQRRKREDEALEQEELKRVARLPRHQNLDLETLGTEEQTSEETAELLSSLSSLVRKTEQGLVEMSAMADAYFEEKQADTALEELREEMQGLRIVSRAKVTMNRIYSAVYHGDNTKDLIFFGDKHGQLGIWDARAPKEEIPDEDGDLSSQDDKEGGKIWRLQPHWPATSKSSLSCCRLDPLDAHNIYTASYDTTLRKLSFETGVAEEVYSLDDGMPSSMDFVASSHEIWLSDTLGVLHHIDTRADRTAVTRYQLSGNKIGCVSVNSASHHAILCASNDRSLKLWDARKLSLAPLENLTKSPTSGERSVTISEISSEDLETFVSSSDGDGTMRGEWTHGKSVSSAYWSPFGNQIVSTSYDDHLRLWTKKRTELDKLGLVNSMRPFKTIGHNCQTGKWLTILRAQWSPNPNAYPHFTIGNMNHTLDVYSGQGELLTSLYESDKVTAVQAVTCSSPTVCARVASGNASGRCVLWGPENLL